MRDLLADRALHAHRVQPRAWGRRRPRSGARRSRSGPRSARRRRDPASSRATARPAKLAPQISTSASRSRDRGALGPARGWRGASRALPQRAPAPCARSRPRRQPARCAEHVVVQALDAVEHPHVHGARHPHARAAPAARTAASAGAPSANRPRARSTCSASSARKPGVASRRRTPPRRRRTAPSSGQVDAVEGEVLAHVADEVGQLEGQPEPRRSSRRDRRRAQQRGHDPADGRRRCRSCSASSSSHDSIRTRPQSIRIESM